MRQHLRLAHPVDGLPDLPGHNTVLQGPRSREFCFSLLPLHERLRHSADFPQPEQLDIACELFDLSLSSFQVKAISDDPLNYQGGLKCG